VVVFSRGFFERRRLAYSAWAGRHFVLRRTKTWRARFQRRCVIAPALLSMAQCLSLAASLSRSTFICGGSGSQMIGLKNDRRALPNSRSMSAVSSTPGVDIAPPFFVCSRTFQINARGKWFLCGNFRVNDKGKRLHGTKNERRMRGSLVNGERRGAPPFTLVLRLRPPACF
jgi:hypothetical protein